MPVHDLEFLLRGLVIGFAIAAPVGPIGLLCIQRTLSSGRRAGLVSGLGAATADAVYGSVAAFGLTAISQALVSQQIWLRLGGGLFLCYLGLRTFLARLAEKPAGAGGRGLVGDYASTFVLTMTNPLTILSFMAVFAGLGLSTGGGYGQAALLVLGVFSGSAAWWLTLSLGVGLLQTRLGPATLRWINRLSGAIIFAFGLAALASLIGPLTR
jgi:threonine/homoserine/homoserine lactone efflux protein